MVLRELYRFQLYLGLVSKTLVCGLDVGGEERGIKDDKQVFNLSN